MRRFAPLQAALPMLRLSVALTRAAREGDAQIHS